MTSSVLSKLVAASIRIIEASEQDRSRSGWRRLWQRTAGLPLVAGALVLAAFSLYARAWRFLCDDAFISFRYARNLAEHGELVFNVGMQPPELVEGYTNFAWVVLLAALARVGVVPETAAPVLTWLAAAAGLVAAANLVDVLTKRRLGGLAAIGLCVAPALLVASPEYMAWSHGGLETAITGALVLGSMAAWSGGRWTTAAALAAFATLCRADALLPIGLYGLAHLVTNHAPAVLRGRGRRRSTVPWRRLALAAAVFAVPVLGHLLWRRSYYGAWVPNTWTIKAHGTLLRSTYGTAYIEAWLSHVHIWLLWPLALLLRPRHALLVVPTVGVLGYGWWIGGDFMAYSRFYLVPTMLLAVLIGWLLADAAALVTAPRPGWLRLGPAFAGFVLASLLGREGLARNRADRERPNGWIDGKWEGITAMDRFARAGLAAGGWMREHLPPQTLITVGAAGAVPYASRLPTIDAFGLVDPVIATLPAAGPRQDKHARPGHQLMAPPKYIKSRDPDLLCHVGYRGASKPRGRVHPAFARGYTWACMQPDPIEDPLSPSEVVDVGYYCCRIATGRTVGPFGPQPKAEQDG